MDYKVLEFLDKFNVGSTRRDQKLKNSTIKQITYSLYRFNEIVKDKNIINNIKKEIIYLFVNRIPLHKQYYKYNDLLLSVYDYFFSIIKVWQKSIKKY